MSPLNQTWHNENRHEKNSFCCKVAMCVCLKDKDFTALIPMAYVNQQRKELYQII